MLIWENLEMRGKEANKERNSIYVFQFCEAQVPNGDVELFEDI